MTRLLRPALTPLIVAVIATASPTRAPAQRTDEQVLAAYRLTEATLGKFVTATRALAALPEPADTLDDLDAESIADIAAFYDRHPPARRALTSAGLTSREYVTFMFALFQAAVGAMLQEQGVALPKETPRDNVVFYQRHKAQLDSVTAALKAARGDSTP